MNPRRPLLVANPHAGSSLRRKALFPLMESFARQFPEGQFLPSLPDPLPDSFFTRYTDRDLLVVYGGDGSIHRILQATPLPSAPILALSGGTGNVLSTYLGTSEFSKSPESLWQNLSRAEQVFLRPGIAGSRRFILMAGAGWDGHAVGFVSGKSLLGPLAYYKAGLHSLFSSDLPVFSLALHLENGDSIDMKGVRWCLASRLPPYFGPFRTPVRIPPDSPSLHVTVVRGHRLGIVGAFIGFLPGLSPFLRSNSYVVKRVEFHSPEGEKSLPFQADGEPIPFAPFMETDQRMIAFLSFPSAKP